VTSVLSSLLISDSNNAAFVLGAPDCTAPNEVEWARRTRNKLDAGGETQILRAKRLVLGVDGLRAFGIEEALSTAGEPVSAINDVLATESFADKLADLQSAISRLESALREA